MSDTNFALHCENAEKLFLLYLPGGGGGGGGELSFPNAELETSKAYIKKDEGLIHPINPSHYKSTIRVQCFKLFSVFLLKIYSVSSSVTSEVSAVELCRLVPSVSVSPLLAELFAGTVEFKLSRLSS